MMNREQGLAHNEQWNLLMIYDPAYEWMEAFTYSISYEDICPE